MKNINLKLIIYINIDNIYLIKKKKKKKKKTKTTKFYITFRVCLFYQKQLTNFILIVF